MTVFFSIKEKDWDEVHRTFPKSSPHSKHKMNSINNCISVLNKKALIFLLIWVIFLSTAYSTLSLLRHNHFQSGAFDLGIYDQAIWQYSRFQYPYNTVKERFILGDHLTLTLPLLAPLFWIWDDASILLIFQAFFISCSAVAIYKLAQNRKLPNFAALTLSILYSLFFGVQYGVYFDFHPIIIGVGLIAWFLYVFEAGKKKIAVILFTLILLTQENLGIAIASVGFYYLFNQNFRKKGVFFILSGITFSLIAAKLTAFFSPTGYQYLWQLNFNPIEIVQGFFDSEERRQVWLYSLSWFTFLPMLSLGALLAMLFDLSQYYVLGRNFSWMQGPFLHHRAILTIFLTLGTLDALVLLRVKKLPLIPICIILLASAVFLQYYFHFPLNKLSKKEYWEKSEWINDNHKLFAVIPENASLAAAQNLVPHLTHRNKIYLAWPRLHDFPEKPCGRKTCSWLDFSAKPEYLVLDLHPNQWVTQLLESNENFSDAVNNMEKMGKIKLTKKFGASRLYKIKY